MTFAESARCTAAPRTAASSRSTTSRPSTRQLELALRDALAREQALRIDAERHVEFVEAFCGALAHTLRNPLGAILMGSKHLARQGLGERPTTLATRIATSAEHMSRLIDKLLDLATVRTSGTLPLEHTHLDLADICERVATEHEASAPRCRIAIESSGNTVGLWDRDRLMQCFGGVVGNAIAHGATACTLHVTADRHDPAWVVARYGAAPRFRRRSSHLFEPFSALQGPGLGLTMFIARQIALAHGGTFELTSNTSDGTHAHVRLPRFPSTSQAASEVCASGSPRATHTFGAAVEVVDRLVAEPVGELGRLQAAHALRAHERDRPAAHEIRLGIGAQRGEREQAARLRDVAGRSIPRDRARRPDRDPGRSLISCGQLAPA